MVRKVYVKEAMLNLIHRDSMEGNEAVSVF